MIHVSSLQDLKAVHEVSTEHGDHGIRSAARFMGSIMAAAAGSEIKVRNICIIKIKVQSKCMIITILYKPIIILRIVVGCLCNI